MHLRVSRPDAQAMTFVSRHSFSSAKAHQAKNVQTQGEETKESGSILGVWAWCFPRKGLSRYKNNGLHVGRRGLQVHGMPVDLHRPCTDVRGRVFERAPWFSNSFLFCIFMCVVWRFHEKRLRDYEEEIPEACFTMVS